MQRRGAALALPCWGAHMGLSTWPLPRAQESVSVGAPEPVLRAGRAQGQHLAPSAIPYPVWPEVRLLARLASVGEVAHGGPPPAFLLCYASRARATKP